MTENTNPQKQYYVYRDGFEEGKKFNEEDFNNMKDSFFRDFKEDGHAVEITPMAFDDEIDDNEAIMVHRHGYPEQKIISGAEFKKGREQFLSQYDPQEFDFNRAKSVNYYGDQLREYQERIAAIDKELAGLPQEPATTITGDPRVMNGSINQMQAQMEEERANPELSRTRALKREREELNRKWEENPAWQQYKASVDDDIISQSERIGKMQDVMRKKDPASARAERIGLTAGGPAANVAAISTVNQSDPVYNSTMESLKAANVMLDKAKKIVEAPSRYGGDEKGAMNDFWQAAKNNAIYAFSANNLINAGFDMHLVDAIKKIQGSEEGGKETDIAKFATSGAVDNASYLNEGEKELVKAFVKLGEAQNAFSNRLSRSYQAGESFVKSLGFMADFALYGGVGEAVADAAVGNVVKAAGRNAWAKLGAETLAGGIKSLVMTPLMPSSYTNFMDGLLQMDEDGQVDLSSRKLLQTAGDVLIETVSETIGAKPLEALGIPLSKINMPDWARIKYPDWAKTLGNSSWSHAMKQAGYNGFFEEMFEEVTGNALRAWTGVDNNALKDFVKMDNLLVTAGAFAPMSLLGAPVSLVQHKVATNDVTASKEALEQVLSKIQDEDLRKQISSMIANTDFSTPEDFAHHMTDVYQQIVQNGGDAREAASAAMRYTTAVAKLKVLTGAMEEQKDVERSAQLLRLDQQMGNENWHHYGKNGASFVRTVTDADGNEMFVLGELDGDMSLVDREGKLHYMKTATLEQGVADGTMKDSGEQYLWDYLDKQEEVTRKADEQVRMQNEAKQAQRDLTQLLQPQTRVKLPDGGEGSVVTTDSGRVIVQKDDGTSQDYEPQELANLNGIRLIPETDEERDAKAVALEEKREKTRQDLTGKRGAKVEILGQQYTLTGVIRNRDREDKPFTAYVKDANGQNHSIELSDEETDEMMLSMQEMPVEQPVVVDDGIPRDKQGNPIPMRTNTVTNEQEIDWDALWEQSPETWVERNDANPDAIISSDDKIASKLAEKSEALATVDATRQELARQGGQQSQIDQLNEQRKELAKEVARIQALADSRMPKAASIIAEQPAAETPQAQAIPVNENGEKQYTQAPVQATYEDIYGDEAFDNDEEAFGFIEGKVATAQAAVADADKALAKVQEKNRKGAYRTTAEYAAAKREAQQTLDAARQERDYWNGVKDLADARRTGAAASQPTVQQPVAATPAASVAETQPATGDVLTEAQQQTIGLVQGITPEQAEAEARAVALDKEIAYINGQMAKHPERRAELMEQKAAAIRNYLDAIQSEGAEVVVATRGNILETMRRNGSSADDIQDVEEALKEVGVNVRGFRSNGQMYEIADDIADAENARSTYVHERQHGITRQNGYISFVLAMNMPTEEMRQAVKDMSGVSSYSKASRTTLADEMISMAMEVAYSVPEGEVESALKAKGVTNRDFINFVKTIDHEQRSDRHLRNARRIIPRAVGQERGGRENGRDSRAISRGDIQREGPRPGEDGEQGAGGEQGAVLSRTGQAEREQRPSGIIASETDAAQEVGGGISFSIATEPDVAAKIRDFSKSKEGKELGWTEQQVESIIQETEGLMDAIHAAVSGDKYYDEWAQRHPTTKVDWRDGVEKPTVTWARNNIEYKYDMSADLLCINNEGMETVLSSPTMAELMIAISRDTKEGFTSNDYLRLYETLRDMGFVVPCKGCFDAAMRLKMLPSVAQKFVAQVNKTIDERNADPAKFDAELQARTGDSATIGGLPTSAKNKEDAIRIGVAGDNLTEHLDWTQLMSAEGQTKALSDWGGIFRAWQRTGAGRPKDKLLPEPWSGDIVSTTTTIIGKYGEKTPSFRDVQVNQGTGLRRNSHSEFRPILAIDEIQFMREAYLRGLTVFKYMKQLDDVRLFGNLGVKFNMSFFPAFMEGAPAAGLDVNGDYIASEESVGGHEFEYKDADGKTHYDGMKGWQEAQKYLNKDVSLSSVVFSIPHLIKSFTDVPTSTNPVGMWGSLIPFHASGSTAHSLESQGLGKARAIGGAHGFDEAMTDYDKGVTNFEAVQNDRFGEGWEIVEGKKAGTKVEPGHKLEFANGTHYYNERLGLHLFQSFYIYDNELKRNHRDKRGNIITSKAKAAGHPFAIDYNDKVREIGTDTAYKDAADFYIQQLRGLGLIPRFDFEVPENIFLQMCADAKVDPRHPKLGWKGEGNAWSPADSEAYYSLWCDYGMIDPATGKWSPHEPVGKIDAEGNRVFELPDNAIEIIKDGVARYSERRTAENARVLEAIEEYAKRSVADGKLTQEDADRILGEARSNLQFSRTAEPQAVDNVMAYINGTNAEDEMQRRQTEDLFRRAKERFGATEDIREAGYILPDGAMLDFSGRHWVEPGSDTSYLAGDRQVDHRDIADLAYERDGNTPTGVETDMTDFIQRGAIRIHNGSGAAINLAQKPTAAQQARLRRLIDMNNGDVWVDFGNGDRSDHYVEYGAAKSARVLNDINRYFDEGYKPEGTLRFSLRGEKGAQTAQDAQALANLVVAEQMEEQGKDAKTIWLSTGWERGKDGEWRNEIPDGEPKVIENTKKATVKDVIDAPELFESYPQLGDIKIKFNKSRTYSGSYDRNTNTIGMHTDNLATAADGKPYLSEEGMSTMMHELQHVIQSIEGFARGGNPAWEMNEYLKEMAIDLPELVLFSEMFSRANSQEKLIRAGRQKVADIARKNASNYKEDMSGLADRLEAIDDQDYAKMVREGARLQKVAWQKGEDRYNRLAGEVEARNVNTRMGMSDASKSLTPPSETEDIRREEQGVRFSRAQEANKVPGQQYPTNADLMEDELRFSLSKNNRKTIEAWMNKRQDLSEDERKAVVDYIDSLPDAKTQLATGKWFAQGAVRLPEDQDKIDQAISVANKAKVDPLQYDSPMALLDAHADFKPTEKRINPDDVPTLHRAQEYPEYGVVVYDVDESDESRQNMREIINTHFGKEASPWCLLQGDGNGNLTEDSKRYWRHYNEYPKKVAFKDGKLLSFSANDRPVVVWWDRQDKSHYGIPVTMKIEGDEQGRSVDHILDDARRQLMPEPGAHLYKGNRQNGLYEEWDYSGEKLLERKEYKDGKPNGIYEEYYPNNGQIRLRTTTKDGHRVGLFEEWYDNGQPSVRVVYDEKQQRDGELIHWYPNGNMAENGHFSHGRQVGEHLGWERDGRLYSREIFGDDGNLKIREQYSEGQLEKRSRMRKDGYVVERYRRDGSRISKIGFDSAGQYHGLTEFYRPDGQLDRRQTFKYGTREGKSELYHPNGKKWIESNFKKGEYDGIFKAWNEQGDLLEWKEYKDGKVVRDYLAEGVSSEDNVQFSKTKGFSRNKDEFKKTLSVAVEERGIVMPGLSDKEIMIVPVIKEHPFDESLPDKDLKKQVKNYAKSHDIIGVAYCEDIPINISVTSIGEMADPKAYHKSVNKSIHLAAITEIKNIISNSTNAEVHPDYIEKRNGERIVGDYNDGILMHRLYGAIDIDGKVYRVKTTVKEILSEQSNKAYAYEVTNIELLDGHTESSNNGTTPRESNNSISGTKLLQGVEKSYDPGKYLLEESGNSPQFSKTAVTPQQDADYLEAVKAGDMDKAQRAEREAAKVAGYPITAYHGTWEGPFNIFKANEWLKEENGDTKIKGWFSLDKDFSEDYGPAKPYHLKIQNPIEIPFYEKTLDEWKQWFADKGVADVKFDSSIEEESLNGADYGDGVRKYYPVELFDSPRGFNGDGNITEAIEKAGYDGIYYPQEKAYAPFRETQIKSADPVTYDNDGNVIPLSQRFNPENDDIRFSRANENQRIFVSNAEAAVDAIPMAKATPQQWLKMIESKGGLKAGEDKWIGLSDWLKEQDAKTLTKQEVQDYIAQNQIQIEETRYGEEAEKDYADAIDSYEKEYLALVDEGEEKGEYNAFEYGYEQMVEKYGDDFESAFFRDGTGLSPTHDFNDNLTDEAKYFLDQRRGDASERPINETRISYTTEGLDNKREIALTVPTIEPWNESDQIHFGDAGEGRAVAWIRFGETKTNPQSGSYYSRNIMDELEKKYGNSRAYDKMTDEDVARAFYADYIYRGAKGDYADYKDLFMKSDIGGERAENVYPIFEEMVKGNAEGKRVLFIDEIQSKRHQDAREKGYKSSTPVWVYDPSIPIPERERYSARKMGARWMIYKDGEPESTLEAESEDEAIAKYVQTGAMYEHDVDKRIPAAPFEKNWHELAMKRMLRLAAEEGYDYVAWTTGDQQAERYDMKSAIGKLYASKDGDKYYVEVYDPNGKEITFNGLIGDSRSTGTYTPEELANVFGKEGAKEIISAADALPSEDEVERLHQKAEASGTKEDRDAWRKASAAEIDGSELFKGEGMKGFYDQMLPRFMDKYGKKWGVKTEDMQLPNLANGITAHAIPVTEEMKESVMEGQLMFSKTAESPVAYDESANAVEDAIKEAFDILGISNNALLEEPQHYRDQNDGVRTALMDAVGRETLSDILGRDNTRNLMLNVYRDLPDDLRKAVAEDAVRNRGANVAEAMQSLASEAAVREARGENTEDYDTMWESVRANLQDALAGIGINISLSLRDVKWMMAQPAFKGHESDPLLEAGRQVVALAYGKHRSQQRYKDDGIAFSRKRDADNTENVIAADAYNRAANDVVNRLKESFVDQYQSVQKFVEAIENETGQKAKPFEDIRLALNQMSSKALAAMNNWIRKYNIPMWDAIKAVMKAGDYELHDVERYVMLKHGLERNEVFAKRDAKEYYQKKYDKAVADIKASKDLDAAAKANELEHEKRNLERRLQRVDAGTDRKYLEFRQNDYGGLTGLYSDYGEGFEGKRRDETQEEYNRRAAAARKPNYTKEVDTGEVDQYGNPIMKTVVDMEAMEDAARAEVAIFEKYSEGTTDELWKRINAATKATLREQYNANIISRKQYESVKDMFQYYVPLRGFADATAEDFYDYYTSDQRSNFTPPMLKAEGRKSKAESPFGYIAAAESSGIAQNTKNEAKLTLYYFVSNRQGNSLVSVSDVWYEKTGEKDEQGRDIFAPAYPPFNEDMGGEEAKRKFEDWQKLMEEKAANGLAYRGSQKLTLPGVIHMNKRHDTEHVVNFKLGGKDMMMYINGNPRVAQAINNELNYNAEKNVIIDTMNQVLRVMSALNTQLNPEFWISNFQRDVLFAIMGTSVKEDKEYNKAFRKNLAAARKVVKMKKAYDNGTLGDSHDEQLYREFADNGGVTGYTVVYNNEYWEDKLKEYSGEKRNVVARMLDSMQAITDFGEAIEQLTRFAAFKTSREAGRDIKEAVRDAKELTVNFNRKGSGKAISLEEASRLTYKGRPLSKWAQVAVSVFSNLSPYGRRLVMFFNAAIQGLNAMVKLYKADLGKAMAWSGAYVALGMMNAVLHSMLDGDDDDDYLDIPDWERRNNAMLGYGGVYLKWALPQEARGFYAMGDAFVNHALGREPHKNLMGEILESVSDVMPVDVSSGFYGLAPSVTTPIVDIVRNKNFMGSRVYNEQKYLSDEDKKNIPEYRSALPNTSRVWTGLSKGLNWLSGGDEYSAGVVNINPNIMEHLFEGYTGGLGTTVGKSAQFFEDIIGGDLVVRDTPFLRRILSVNDERYRNAHTTELYYYYEGIAEDTKRQIKEATKKGDDAKLDRLYDSKEYEILNIYEGYRKEIKWYNDELKATDDTDERRSLMKEQDAVRKEMLMEISNLKDND